MDELTRRIGTIELGDAPPLGGGAEAALLPNTLYLVKIRAVAADVGEEVEAVLDVGYGGRWEPWVSLRTILLRLPAVSDSDDCYGQRGKWYEQTLFLATDDIANRLRWRPSASSGSRLMLRLSTLFFERQEPAALTRILRQMKAVSAKLHGKEYKPFLGIEDVEQHSLKIGAATAEPRLPRLRPSSERPANMPRLPRVGVVGDEMLVGLLEQSFSAHKIGPETISLLENGAFDLVLLQQRAVGIGPPGITDSDEQQYLSDLRSALAQSSAPIVELTASPANEVSSTLRALRNSPPLQISCAEHELVHLAPVRGASWHPGTIALPCASDLYQHPEFLSTAQRLVGSGFSLAVSESNYDHVPIRTWERFQSPFVKVYGRLSAGGQAELFRNCGFVLLPGRSLRPLTDIVNLAIMALMSGALPIIVGRQFPAPLDDVIEGVWGFPELYEYLERNSSPIVRERLWLARFRKYMDLSRRGRLRWVLGELAAGVPHKGRIGSPPAAELICVSKRPANLPQILDNCRRQAYGNLGLHLIWNVPAAQAQICLRAARERMLPNMRVTVLDEGQNIGSCLNYGIRESRADYWFKMDDDDYYGVNYVQDLINYYEATGFDAIGKPSAFIQFASSGKVYLRNHALAQVRAPLGGGRYFCGATLSARLNADIPLFSNSHRNSCDSNWVESLQSRGIRVGVSDLFNYCIKRTNPEEHTWQVAEERIENSSTEISASGCMEWLDAA